jgi:radical SAM superfamily enzyme YgiQ (UPF0313 family)
MGKPPVDACIQFRRRFNRISRRAGLKQFLSYYFMAAYPGCTLTDMRRLRRFTRDHLQTAPEQIQIFTPTPSTYGTLMFYTEQDPFDGAPLFVEKDVRQKRLQKESVLPARSHSRSYRRQRKPQRKI